MKISSFLCTYNDWEYLDETIQSFKHHVDKLYIIEGAWQSSQKFAAAPRSNQQTYDIINKHVDDKKVFLIQANEARERNQRQVGLELAKKDGADWCWMLDSDEVYKDITVNMVKKVLQNNLTTDVYGFRLRSHNFINSFKKWYNGDYWRIYRVTPHASFYMDNDVNYPDFSGKTITLPQYVFWHYNYVKMNSNAFWLKMNYQAEQDPSFTTRVLPQYGFDDAKKHYKIPDDIPIYTFHGRHPRIMKNHPYFVNNIYNDVNLEFD